MTATFTQTAFAQLPPLPVNYCGDPLQTTQALTGLGQMLSSWTLRVANALNKLIPNGGPVPVSQGGTGSASFGTYTSNVVLIANEVNINVAANVAQLTSLPAGTYMLWGECWLDTNTGGATLSAAGFRAGLTTISATLPTVPADGTARTNVGLPTVPSSVSAAVYPIGPAFVTLSVSTTYFLVAAATTSAGNAFGYGKICALRFV